MGTKLCAGSGVSCQVSTQTSLPTEGFDQVSCEVASEGISLVSVNFFPLTAQHVDCIGGVIIGIYIIISLAID